MGSTSAPGVVPSERRDGDSIRRLLTRCDLIADRIDGDATFWVIHGANEVEGCVALEVYGATVILRSLAVAPECQGRGWGRALVERAVHEAEVQGADRVVALTLTVEDLFLKCGFTRISRESLSELVRASWQFTVHACDGAACLERAVS